MKKIFFHQEMRPWPIKRRKKEKNLTLINLTGAVIQSHFRVTCVEILLCPCGGATNATFCTFLLSLTWMLVCFSVLGQKFIVQWSNILLHENPQGKSVMLWKKNTKLIKGLYSFHVCLISAGGFTFQCTLNKTGEIVFSYHQVRFIIFYIYCELRFEYRSHFIVR